MSKLSEFIKSGKREKAKALIKEAAWTKLFKKLEPLIDQLEERKKEAI